MYRIAVCFNIWALHTGLESSPPPPSGSFDLSLLFDLIYPAMPPLSCYYLYDYYWLTMYHPSFMLISVVMYKSFFQYLQVLSY